MRKTFLEHINIFPLGIRKRAIVRAVSKNRGDARCLFKKYESYCDAINDSFCWSDTPEGHLFWSQLHFGEIKEAILLNKDILKSTKP